MRTHWPLGPALAAIVVVCLQPVVATDLWLHLAVGRQIVQERSIPRTDTFSHTASGSRFVPHEWLSQVLLYGVHRLGGLTGLLALKLFLAGLAFGLLYAVAYLRCGEPLAAAGLVTIAAFPASLYLDYRPAMFSLVLLALLLLQLEHVRIRGIRWSTWIPFVVLLFLLWGNLHGMAPVGLIVLAVVCSVEGLGLWVRAGDDAGRKAQVSASAVALPIATGALCLNPQGAYALWYGAWLASSRPALEHIVEWQSPDFQTWEMRGIEILLLAGIALLAIVRGPRRLSDVALLLSFAHATLTSQRHGAVFAAIAVSAYAGMIREWLYDVRGVFEAQWDHIVRPALGAGLVAACALFVVARAPSGDVARTSMGLSRLPVGAVEYLGTHLLDGNGFNLYEWGGYMMWTTPQVRVFIDGRADLYYDGAFEAYLTALRGADGWHGVFRQYGVRWALIAPGTRLRSRLVADGWQEVYRDGVSVVVVHPDGSGATGRPAS